VKVYTVDGALIGEKYTSNGGEVIFEGRGDFSDTRIADNEFYYVTYTTGGKEESEKTTVEARNPGGAD
jgi:hypothetical protein